MAALTPTLVKSLDASAGNLKIKVFTVTPESASDTVDLTTYFNDIHAVISAHITAGADANLVTAHVTESAESLTIVTKGADGNASTNWDSASITLTVMGEDEPQ
jgi:hypothetical protein